MGTYLFLVPISLGLGLVGLASFIWSLETGQYEDLAGSSQRILFEPNLERGSGAEGSDRL